jgi:N-acetylglucosamine-6-phosphate deacetylase
MLGMSVVKGNLVSDADADLVVIEEEIDANGWRNLRIDQVWKFGTKVWDREL